MIKISLLPDEFKKKSIEQKLPFKLEITKFEPHLLRAVGCFLAVLVGFHFLLCISIALKSKSLGRLDSKWQSLQPQKVEIERLNSEIASIEKTALPMRRLFKRKCLWSKKLNRLNDLITPGVWLARLSTETRIKDAKMDKYIKIIELQGYAASSYGDETGLIGRFIKALQGDEEFFQDFSEIKLGPMQTEMLDNYQIMNFKLFCFFKED